MTNKPSLEALVDDYLDKHRAAVEVGRLRERALRDSCSCQVDKQGLTQKFIVAHNKRAAAFRALAEARSRAGER